MTMTLVSTVNVGAGGATSIDFTSIPQTGTDLLVVFSARSTTASATAGSTIQFNSDTGASNYSHRILYGSGSAVGSYTQTTSSIDIGDLPAASATVNTFGNVLVYIPNYTSNTAKSVSSDSVGENNATAANAKIVAGKWVGTAAITSISLTCGTLAQYSTASLYTIRKGSGGATVS